MAGRQFEQIRCPKCGRLLYRLEREALRPRKAIESKCGKCNAVTYRIGDPVETPDPDPRALR